MNALDSLKIDIKELINNDSAHDYEHIMRVYKNAQKICKKEKVNDYLVLCAVLLHDIVSYPKSDMRAKSSSIFSAKKSISILKKYNFSDKEISIICDAIRDHSFSQQKTPTTLEGKILQDADRLDALGAIGIARVFATGGSLRRAFYNIDDPFCNVRTPNDKIWTVDHFYQKLLKLESLMNTKSGKLEAKKRTRIIIKYLKQLKQEL